MKLNLLDVMLLLISSINAYRNKLGYSIGLIVFNNTLL